MSKTKEIIMFSDSELLNIHKALHDKRRRFVEVKGTKVKVFEHSNLRQIKFFRTIFSEFKDNNAKFANNNATIAIKLGSPIKYWNVVEGSKVYKNKRDYYAKIQE